MQQAEQQQQLLHQQQNGSTNPNDSSLPGSYAQNQAGGRRAQISGGRFDFEDGGTYCGGWEDGKAHGHGVCTGPKHQGAYSGAWNYGFEVSGAYIWPSGSHYEGQWQNGRRHGLGVEQIGRQIYRGEWSKDGHKGRYGVRESTVSTAKYEGTWNLGYQDGYGCETYADGGKYQGQWKEGKRHGYGIRTSAPFGLASHHRRKNIHASLSSLRSNENANPDKQNVRSEEIRGGFVLTAKSDKMPPPRRNSLTEKTKKGFLSGLKMRKQRSTGDLEKRGTITSGSIRSTMSTASWLSTGSEQSNLTMKSTHTESNASFTMEDEQLDPTVVETYMGEWKKDKRCGYGVAERSDGLKYEGEWYNNKKHGYGVTTFHDGTIEEGKYKNNALITSEKKKHLFLARSRKCRERATASLNFAQRALKMAMQRSDMAVARADTATGKAQNADVAAEQARIDCELAVQMAREFAPDFKPTVLERFEKLRYRERYKAMPSTNLLTPTGNSPPAGVPFINNSTQRQQQQQQQQQQHQLQSSMAFSKNRRPSQAIQQDAEFPVPSSMYSQQLPVSPQTDLTSMIKHPQPGFNSIGSINQMALQQQQQQQQQQQLQKQQHQLQQQQNNPQMNPAYQYQQQQPPGPSINNMQLAGGSNLARINTKPTQNIAPSNLSSSGSPVMNQALNDSEALRNAESMHMANNIQMQKQQQLQQQQQQLQQQQQQQQIVFQQQQQMLQQQHQQQQQQLLMQQQQQQQQQNQQQQLSNTINLSPTHNQSQIRRQSQPLTDINRSGKPPMLGQINQQSSIDHFDHYKRPPSRDSSIDRYTRAASRLSGAFAGSRQASVDRTATTGLTNDTTTTTTTTTQIDGRQQRAGSVFRAGTPAPATPTTGTATTTGNGSIPTGTGRLSRAGTPSIGNRMTTTPMESMNSALNQPFEDVILRQRTLGQDIVPSPLQPKRTESLYLPPKPVTAIGGGGGGGGGNNKQLKSVPINVTLQRKKSLPDFQELPRATEAMSREEVSALGSARREAVRRQIEVNERLKANPLLYLVSPQVKDWFSRQQLVLVVLFINIFLALFFIKMLT